MDTTRSVQRALLARGYDLGPGRDDGVLGRATIAAIAAFQAAEQVDVKWPGTIGPKTLAALGLAEVVPVVLPWVAEARRLAGLHEVRDAKRLDKILRLDASKTPWCGALVQAVIAATLPAERLPANPLAARGWLSFGEAIKGPQVGAVAVFWRGSRDGWQGHVGFVVGHDLTHLHVLGGNQGDIVSVVRIAKSRLLGLRWPVTTLAAPTAPLPMTTIGASISTNEA